MVFHDPHGVPGPQLVVAVHVALGREEAGVRLPVVAVGEAELLLAARLQRHAQADGVGGAQRQLRNARPVLPGMLATENRHRIASSSQNAAWRDAAGLMRLAVSE
jgi:hypothetical protein